MYDFLVSNDMILCDLCHPQAVNYTYFCITRGVYTWIDHVAGSVHDSANVSKCSIIPLCPSNLSDHLPILTEFSVAIDSSKTRDTGTMACSNFVHPCWRNSDRNHCYADLIASKLAATPLPQPIPAGHPSTEVKSAVDSALERLCCIIHSSAKEAGIVPSREYHPKRFWCPELSLIRDRKRFWWSLWVSCGRPRHGHVFDCWKSAKRLFRCASRRFAQDVADKGIRELNSLFHSGNTTKFWKKISRKKRGCSSSLHASEFREFYSSIMSDVDPDLSDQQLSISSVVQEWFSSSTNQFYPQDISSDVLRVKLPVFNSLFLCLFVFTCLLYFSNSEV